MKVSVITPFYEGNAYMDAYQEMLLRNEARLLPGDALEVLIINDSPQTAVKLAGTVSTRRNWRVLRNEKNEGIHGSRLRGLSEATGDYVIFLDQDDLLADDAIAAFLSFAKERAAAFGRSGIAYEVIVANASLEQENGTVLWYRTKAHKKLVGDYDTYLTVGTMIISPGQCLIPKRLIPALWQAHPLQKNGADDYFLWLLLLQQGVSFTLLDRPLYTHRFTGDNLSRDTRVTDMSSYEFIEYLEAEPAFPAVDAKKLRRMLAFKAAFRSGGFFTKCRLILKEPGLFMKNLVFKIKTRTRYGFHRG